MNPEHAAARAALKALYERGGARATQSALRQFGAERLSDVDDFEAFAAACQERIARLPAPKPKTPKRPAPRRIRLDRYTRSVVRNAAETLKSIRYETSSEDGLPPGETKLERELRAVLEDGVGSIAYLRRLLAQAKNTIAEESTLCPSWAQQGVWGGVLAISNWFDKQEGRRPRHSLKHERNPKGSLTT